MLNNQMHNTMQAYNIDDLEDTLSLSNFHIMEDDTIDSKQFSSSSSSLSSDQDFLGFFSEELSLDSKSPENIVFCGKVVSSGRPIWEPETKRKTNPLFRSKSDSFRFMRLNVSSSKSNNLRSKSMPTKSESCKSRFMMFMFGSGSSKFRNKVDISDIKSRQLRQQSLTTVSGWVDGGRTSANKGWWRFVDVLGCGSGYGRETAGSFD